MSSVLLLLGIAMMYSCRAHQTIIIRRFLSPRVAFVAIVVVTNELESGT